MLRGESKAAGEMEDCAVACCRRILSTEAGNSDILDSSRSLSERVTISAEVAESAVEHAVVRLTGAEDRSVYRVAT